MIEKIKLLGLVIVAAETVTIMAIYAAQSVIVKAHAFWLVVRQLTW